MNGSASIFVCAIQVQKALSPQLDAFAKTQAHADLSKLKCLSL
jgi:hypothetical protein